MSVFQNTISYATFKQATPSLTLIADEWVKFGSSWEAVTEIQKEIDIVGNSGLSVKVNQIGTYYVDFSFIANDGDGKTYSVAPYVNATRLSHYALKFHQQATQQKYEVSMGFIVPLTNTDQLSFEIYVDTLPTLDLSITDAKISMFNLQQLGIH